MFHHWRPYLQALWLSVTPSHTPELFGIGESAMEAFRSRTMNAMINCTNSWRQGG